MIGFFKKLFTGTTIDFKDLVKKGAVIIDVRSPGEYKSGHIQGSKNFPLDNIRSKVTELKKTGKPVITVCRSGTRSGIAKGILKAAGIEVYNGGAWTSLRHKI
ncbi:MAG: rhodanese-like domain-containing protein [Chitinophagaceae bacterium]|nr:rhodanese-like domain-containing protein [Chitinophagaceae bacterium]